MTDDQVIEKLRRERARCSATELAELLNELIDGQLSESTLVMYFKRAFPDIPLRVLREAGIWHRVSNGGGTDAELNQLLSEWLPTPNR